MKTENLLSSDAAGMSETWQGIIVPLDALLLQLLTTLNEAVCARACSSSKVGPRVSPRVRMGSIVPGLGDDSWSAGGVEDDFAHPTRRGSISRERIYRLAVTLAHNHR